MRNVRYFRIYSRVVSRLHRGFASYYSRHFQRTHVSLLPEYRMNEIAISFAQIGENLGTNLIGRRITDRCRYLYRNCIRITCMFQYYAGKIVKAISHENSTYQNVFGISPHFRSLIRRNHYLFALACPLLIYIYNDKRKR